MSDQGGGIPASQLLYRSRFYLVPLGSQREFWYKNNVHVLTTVSPSDLSVVLYVGIGCSELIYFDYKRRGLPLKVYHQSRKRHQIGSSHSPYVDLSVLAGLPCRLLSMLLCSEFLIIFSHCTLF